MSWDEGKERRLGQRLWGGDPGEEMGVVRGLAGGGGWSEDSPAPWTSGRSNPGSRV